MATANATSARTHVQVWHGSATARITIPAEAIEPFRLESVPRPSGSGQQSEFRNNTKADGSPLSQMVLFSGSNTCVAGQQDLFQIAEAAR